MVRSAVIPLALLTFASAGYAALPTPIRLTYSDRDAGPAWSPDDAWIAFDSGRPGSNGTDVWLVPTGGGVAKRLTDLPSNEFGIAWSPDARTLAFYGAWNADLFTVSVDGGTPVPFAAREGAETDPAWSPDGTMLAYTSNEAGNNYDIWRQPVGGQSAVRLTTHPAEDREPSWSPDSQTIVFASERDGLFQLWSIPAAGGTPTRVSEMLALSPSWSRDGEWIVFDSDGDLYLIRMKDGEAVQLTAGPELDRQPSWSPDGSRVVFSRRTGDALNLFVVEVGPVTTERTSWSRWKAGGGP